MFLRFRRFHKCQCLRLLTLGLLLCVLMVSWGDLEHHVISHVRSYTYHYLFDSYDFLVPFSHRYRKDGSKREDDASMNYSYLINHPWKCGDGRRWDDILLLLFVKSSPGNFKRREAIRDTWGDESFVQAKLGVNMRLMFAIGLHPDIRERSSMQAVLLQEDKVYGDLIQQNFLDTFHNLTTKLILQFHWSHMFCPQAQFLMSADDDIFIHTPNLVKYLLHLQGSKMGPQDVWVGHVHRGAPPIRLKNSKYYVSYDLYPWPSYPDYTSGAGYVVSRDVAAKIYQATQVLNSSMYIDDVFMGMCGKAMGISAQDHVYFSGGGKAPYHPCIYDHMITSHDHAADVRSMWKEVTNRSAQSNSRGFLHNLYCLAVKVMLLCRPNLQSTYSCLAAFS